MGILSDMSLLGIQRCNDFRCDVYSNVSMAYRFCFAVPGNSYTGDAKRKIFGGRILYPSWNYGISRIPDTILLHDFSCVSRSRILHLSDLEKELETSGCLCGSLHGFLWCRDSLLSIGTFPYFPGVSWK